MLHRYTVEEYLEGDFTKYNNIFGNEEFKPKGEEETKHHDVSAAFSHFRCAQRSLVGIKLASICA